MEEVTKTISRKNACSMKWRDKRQRKPQYQQNKLSLTEHAFFLLVVLVIFSVYLQFALQLTFIPTQCILWVSIFRPIYHSEEVVFFRWSLS